MSKIIKQWIALPPSLGEIIRREAKETGVPAYRHMGQILSELDLTKIGMFPQESTPKGWVWNDSFRIKLQLEEFLYEDLMQHCIKGRFRNISQFLRRAMAYYARSSGKPWDGQGFISPIDTERIFDKHFKSPKVEEPKEEPETETEQGIEQVAFSPEEKGNKIVSEEEAEESSTLFDGVHSYKLSPSIVKEVENIIGSLTRILEMSIKEASQSE